MTGVRSSPHGLDCFAPDRVRAIALLSVPYTPRGERSIIDHIRATDPEGPFAYMLALSKKKASKASSKLTTIEALSSACTGH